MRELNELMRILPFEILLYLFILIMGILNLVVRKRYLKQGKSAKSFTGVAILCFLVFALCIGFLLGRIAVLVGLNAG